MNEGNATIVHLSLGGSKAIETSRRTAVLPCQSGSITLFNAHGQLLGS